VREEGNGNGTIGEGERRGRCRGKGRKGSKMGVDCTKF